MIERLKDIQTERDRKKRAYLSAEAAAQESEHQHQRNNGSRGNNRRKQNGRAWIRVLFLSFWFFIISMQEVWPDQSGPNRYLDSKMDHLNRNWIDSDHPSHQPTESRYQLGINLWQSGTTRSNNKGSAHIRFIHGKLDMVVYVLHHEKVLEYDIVKCRVLYEKYDFIYKIKKR